VASDVQEQPFFIGKTSSKRKIQNFKKKNRFYLLLITISEVKTSKKIQISILGL
jgi:hypothetical protein